MYKCLKYKLPTSTRGPLNLAIGFQRGNIDRAMEITNKKNEIMNKVI